MKYALFNYQTEKFLKAPNGERVLFGSMLDAQHEANITRKGCGDLHPVPVEEYTRPDDTAITMLISGCLCCSPTSTALKEHGAEGLKALVLEFLNDTFTESVEGCSITFEDVV